MAITCDEAVEISASYALGALDEAEKATIEEHLEGVPCLPFIPGAGPGYREPPA